MNDRPKSPKKPTDAPPKAPARKQASKKSASKANAATGQRKTLNVRQERFAEFVVSGMSATKAYVKAGYKGKCKVAGSAGPRMLENVGVKARIAQLRAPQTAKAHATKDFKRSFYMEVMSDPKQKMIDRLRASELDAKMAGHFEPDTVVVETGPTTLEAIEARARDVVSALDRRNR